MEPISRRTALILGGVGAAAVIAGGTGLIWSWTSGDSPVPGPDLAQPEILRSTNGRLNVRLTTAEGTVPL
jgi:hypothetical protein